MKNIKSFLMSVLIASMILVMIPSGAMAKESLISPSVANNYSDVKGSWCEKWVASYGYTEIFSNVDGSFRPDQRITRMEFARLMHKSLGISIKYLVATDIKEYYNDVKSSDVGAGELYDLVTCGIIDTKTSFSPNETLKREDMIHYVINACYYVVGNDFAIPDIDSSPFADESKIEAKCVSEVYHAVALGLVNGRGNNTLSPADASTRAEAVAIAGRLSEINQRLKAEVVIKSAAVQADGALNLTLTILNNTNKAITINHGNGQIFDFVFFDKAGNELYRWSKDRMFTMMLVTTKIAPGEEKVFSDSIDAKAYASIKDKIATVKAYVVGTSNDFTINTDGYFLSEIA